jgi:HEAT repeat protein
LIADLILSESPDPTEEIAAIVKEKGLAVGALIELIRSEDFHDPLFPGYGLAPNLAITCLGQIGDKRAIITLFEAIGSGDFFDEDMALSALHAIGEPAKTFLLKVLHGKPLNIDNEKAAIALIPFKDHPDVTNACLTMLKDPEVRRHLPLATYLVLACEGLTDEEKQKELLELANDFQTPLQLKQEIKILAKTWK